MSSYHSCELRPVHCSSFCCSVGILPALVLAFVGARYIVPSLQLAARANLDLRSACSGPDSIGGACGVREPCSRFFEWRANKTETAAARLPHSTNICC